MFVKVRERVFVKVRVSSCCKGERKRVRKEGELVKERSKEEGRVRERELVSKGEKRKEESKE